MKGLIYILFVNFHDILADAARGEYLGRCMLEIYR